MKRLLLLCAALCCWPPASSAFDDALPAPVAAALARAGLPGDALAAIAVPRTRWARPWQYRAEVPMQPGSTMKLVTSAVALDRLGPGHTGRTELLSAAPVEAGVLAGDLVLKGGADTNLDLPALWQMLFELRQRGVHTIGGDLLLDRSLFRPPRIDIGVPPFDESPEWPYNVIPDALMLAGSLAGLSLAAADDGAVSVRLTPPLPGIELDASGLTLATGTPCADWEELWQPPRALETAPAQWRVELRGAFPRRCEAQAALQLLDRDVMAEAQVRALWASLGGRWLQPAGRVREAAAPAHAALLAQHRSRPWGEVLRVINKQSDNPLTRLAFLQLGVAAMAGDATTPTLDLARREVERWFDERAIDRRGLVLDNGSGLSRSERIAPRTLARVIESALDGRYAPDFLASLPIAGEDGTMRRRLKGTPAEGWARLKTGTLKNVGALAGTVRDTRGTTWIVVAMVNHGEAGSSGQARPVLDALVEWVARSGARWR